MRTIEINCLKHYKLKRTPNYIELWEFFDDRCPCIGEKPHKEVKFVLSVVDNLVFGNKKLSTGELCGDDLVFDLKNLSQLAKE